MLYELKKQKLNSENELKLMAAKLYKAKQDGVSSFILLIYQNDYLFLFYFFQKFDDDSKGKNEEVEEKEILDEDTSLETPVDPNAYDNLKMIRNRVKTKN